MRLLFKFSLFFSLAFFSVVPAQEIFLKEDVAAATRLMGLSFSDAERDSMLAELNQNLKYYQQLREISIVNQIPPALLFNPLPAGFSPEPEQKPVKWSKPGQIVLPKNREELAFYPVIINYCPAAALAPNSLSSIYNPPLLSPIISSLLIISSTLASSSTCSVTNHCRKLLVA